MYAKYNIFYKTENSNSSHSGIQILKILMEKVCIEPACRDKHLIRIYIPTIEITLRQRVFV